MFGTRRYAAFVEEAEKVAAESFPEGVLAMAAMKVHKAEMLLRTQYKVSAEKAVAFGPIEHCRIGLSGWIRYGICICLRQ